MTIGIGTAIGLPVVWRGFLVVKFKRHCEHLAELFPHQALTLGPLVQATCSALTELLKSGKVYVCSFGDGVRHVHFWLLLRPPSMRPGMHSVIFNLDIRTALTRYVGVKKWLVPDSEVSAIADQVRELLCHQFSRIERE